MRVEGPEHLGLQFLTRLASLINAAVNKVIERERSALKKDAEFLLGLKGDWERNEAERLQQIAVSTPQPDQG